MQGILSAVFTKMDIFVGGSELITSFTAFAAPLFSTHVQGMVTQTSESSIVSPAMSN